MLHRYTTLIIGCLFFRPGSLVKWISVRRVFDQISSDSKKNLLLLLLVASSSNETKETMAAIRGDDDLFSLMDEMASSQGFSQNGGSSGDKKKTKKKKAQQKASSTTAVLVRDSKSLQQRRVTSRLLPEIQGYGALESTVSDATTEIWSPYVHVDDQHYCRDASPSWQCPTNPEVELCRRRSYERFKKGFYNIFKSAAEGAVAAESDATLHAMRRKESGSQKGSGESDNAREARQQERTITNKTWGELPSHAILERWQFSTKTQEDAAARRNRQQLRQQKNAAKQSSKSSCGTSSSSPVGDGSTVNTTPTAATAAIRDVLVAGRNNATMVDPILVSLQQPQQQHRKGGRHGHERRKQSGGGGGAKCDNSLLDDATNTGGKPSNLLREEIIFQWKRERRRKIGAAAGNSSSAARELEQLEEELHRTFSSSKFGRRVAMISREVKDLARKVEADFFKELGRRAAQRAVSASQYQHHGGKKKKRRDKSIPKISFGDDYDDKSNSRDVTVSYSGLSLRINATHYAKVQVLFDRFNPRGASPTEHRDAFASSLFALLARYDMLEGGGLQSSLTGAVFDVLLKRFDCRTECFASPFNSRYERYCSAFPDTDGPFGSLGSFFDFSPQSGCFQANPPFIADFIDKMREKMDSMLGSTADGTAAHEPLMFIVFIPAWNETSGWKALNESPHLKRHVLLSQKSDPHYYCEGTQHRRQGRYRIATFDTSVFFLQNAKAQKKWPVTDGILQELKGAFSRNPDDDKTKSAAPAAAKLHKTGKGRAELKTNKREVSDTKPMKIERLAETRKRKRKDEKSRQGSTRKKRLVDDDARGTTKQLEILSGILDDSGEGCGSSESCNPVQQGNKQQHIKMSNNKKKKSRKKNG